MRLVREVPGEQVRSVVANNNANSNGKLDMASQAGGMREMSWFLLRLRPFKLTDVNYILCGYNNNKNRTWQRIKIHTLTVKDCPAGGGQQRGRALRWMESSAGLTGKEFGKGAGNGDGDLGQRNGSQSCSRFAGRKAGRRMDGRSWPRLRGQFPVGRLVMQTYATILRCKCNN